MHTSKATCKNMALIIINISSHACIKLHPPKIEMTWFQATTFYTLFHMKSSFYFQHAFTKTHMQGLFPICQNLDTKNTRFTSQYTCSKCSPNLTLQLPNVSNLFSFLTSWLLVVESLFLGFSFLLGILQQEGRSPSYFSFLSPFLLLNIRRVRPIYFF